MNIYFFNNFIDQLNNKSNNNISFIEINLVTKIIYGYLLVYNDK